MDTGKLQRPTLLHEIMVLNTLGEIDGRPIARLKKIGDFTELSETCDDEREKEVGQCGKRTERTDRNSHPAYTPKFVC
jgi:hypothetical protein